MSSSVCEVGVSGGGSASNNDDTNDDEIPPPPPAESPPSSRSPSPSETNVSTTGGAKVVKSSKNSEFVFKLFREDERSNKAHGYDGFEVERTRYGANMVRLEWKAGNETWTVERDARVILVSYDASSNNPVSSNRAVVTEYQKGKTRMFLKNSSSFCTLKFDDDANTLTSDTSTIQPVASAPPMAANEIAENEDEFLYEAQSFDAARLAANMLAGGQYDKVKKPMKCVYGDLLNVVSNITNTVTRAKVLEVTDTDQVYVQYEGVVPVIGAWFSLDSPAIIERVTEEVKRHEEHNERQIAPSTRRQRSSTQYIQYTQHETPYGANYPSSLQPMRRGVVMLSADDFRFVRKRATLPRFHGCETGGDFFGIFSDSEERGQTVSIYFTTGPGPRAKHNIYSFHQDDEYMVAQMNECIEQSGEVIHLGGWHSHHQIGLTEPSSGDRQTVMECFHHHPWLKIFVMVIVTFQVDSFINEVVPGSFQLHPYIFTPDCGGIPYRATLQLMDT